MNKSMIIYIEPYVYSNRTEKDFLFYNTLDGSRIIIKNPGKMLKHLMEILFDESNCFVAEINEKFYNDNEIKSFVIELKDKFIGDLINTNGDLIPVQFSPIINIQEAKTFNGWNIEKNILSFVNTIEIVINNNSNKILTLHLLIDDFFRNPARQFRELDLKYLKGIIALSKEHPYWDINVGGSNAFKYSRLIKLFNQLKDLKNRINIFIPFTIESYHYFNKIHKKYNINKIEYYFIYDNFINNIKLISNKNLSVNVFVNNSKELKNINTILDNYNIYNYNIYPTSKYLQRKNNLYFSEEELFQKTQSIEKILLKGELNPLLYGKLSILENTAVYSNLYKNKLGKLSESSFEDVLRVEIEKRRYWFETRKDIKPCNKCLFQLICSPISMYEWQLKHFSNCFMVEGK